MLTPARRLKILKAVCAKAEKGDTTAALCLARLERYYGREIREASRASRQRLPGDFQPGHTRQLTAPPADMDEVFDAARKAAADAAAKPAENAEKEVRMASPTSITISYSSTTATLPIPSGSTYSDFMQAIVRGGGAWVTNATSGVLTFVPVSQITEATAQ